MPFRVEIPYTIAGPHDEAPKVAPDEVACPVCGRALARAKHGIMSHFRAHVAKGEMKRGDRVKMCKQMISSNR